MYKLSYTKSYLNGSSQSRANIKINEHSKEIIELLTGDLPCSRAVVLIPKVLMGLDAGLRNLQVGSIITKLSSNLKPLKSPEKPCKKFLCLKPNLRQA
ncbi:MAG: hypothetical protein NHB15_03080 [Methanosarcina barkeri]|nr:hypothetical protein [Methanosarcina sp. ERenArc_MAG2]